MTAGGWHDLAVAGVLLAVYLGTMVGMILLGLWIEWRKRNGGG